MPQLTMGRAAVTTDWRFALYFMLTKFSYAVTRDLEISSYSFSTFLKSLGLLSLTLLSTLFFIPVFGKNYPSGLTIDYSTCEACTEATFIGWYSTCALWLYVVFIFVASGSIDCVGICFLGTPFTSIPAYLCGCKSTSALSTCEFLSTDNIARRTFG